MSPMVSDSVGVRGCPLPPRHRFVPVLHSAAHRRENLRVGRFLDGCAQAVSSVWRAIRIRWSSRRPAGALSWTRVPRWARPCGRIRLESGRRLVQKHREPATRFCHSRQLPGLFPGLPDPAAGAERLFVGQVQCRQDVMNGRKGAGYPRSGSQLGQGKSGCSASNG